MPINYSKEKKCFEISGFVHSSTAYGGSMIGTEDCPMNKDFCRKWVIGSDNETKIEKCDRLLGTEGEEYFRIFPLDPDKLAKFRIHCKGSNSIKFIMDD